ncbi:hypothetical protein Tco_0527606 [Tanacetum coccineum]
MSDYDLIGACGANNHYCPGVLGGNTHDGNILFAYMLHKAVFWREHPSEAGTHYFLSLHGVFLGGHTYDGEIMPRKSSEDHKNTRDYIPIISHEYRTPIKEKLRNLESRCIHEGRVVFENFADLNYVRSLFSFVEFECLLEINDQICPRFILEFYSQYQLNYSDEGQMFIEFVIQNQFFSYSLEEFAQILDIPCEGACVFTDKWSLDELAYGVPTDGPYQTNPPSPDDIILSIRIDREGQVRRIRHEEEIDVLEYQILTREIVPTLKPLEKIIWENSYVLYDRVMNPLAAQQERKTRKDRGTRRGRHSSSSSLPLTNHPPLILTMMMMEMAKGPRVEALLPSFVMLIR